MALDHHGENRANWDDRTRAHLGPGGYPVDEFVADPQVLSSVVRHDAAALGALDGLRVVHLQCHIGLDTLSLARLGANVTGVDFSPRAVEAARSIAARANLVARFVEADVHDAPAALGGEAFDLVYVSVGSLCWLPDIAAWGRLVAQLLAPGGRLYVRDAHPSLLSMDDDSDDLHVRFPYFEHPEPVTWDDAQSYSGTTRLTASRHHEWNHGLGEIVTAVLDAGLTLTHLSEQRFLEWPFWPWMERDGEVWVLPGARRDHLPLMFTLDARRA